MAFFSVFDLAHCRRSLVFLTATAAFMLLPGLSPEARLCFYAPFLVTCYYQSSYMASLWNSVFCGLIVDVFSDLPFGFNAVGYFLTTLFLYRQRRHFFSDRSLTLPLMTAFFALLSTCMLWMLFYLLGEKPRLTWKMVPGDFFAMPLIDALYAFFFFTFPRSLFGKPRRRGKDYFLKN